MSKISQLYRPDFDQTLKVGFCDQQKQHNNINNNNNNNNGNTNINNISSINNLILTKH